MPAQSFLEEVIRLGGLPVTRATAHAWMKHDGHDARTCDYTAFSATQVFGQEPMTLAEVLEFIGDAPAQPTAQQKIDYINLHFSCLTEAQKTLVAEGKVKRHYVLNHERDADPEAKADGRIIGDYASRLIGQRAYDMGLPLTVIPAGRIRDAYLERASLHAAPAAIRAPQVLA